MFKAAVIQSTIAHLVQTIRSRHVEMIANVSCPSVFRMCSLAYFVIGGFQCNDQYRMNGDGVCLPFCTANDKCPATSAPENASPACSKDGQCGFDCNETFTLVGTA